MKKILRSALTGELGINLIQKIILEMGCMWYPTGGTEAGIDGTIEILDASTSEATNQVITVQSKAFSEFQAESANSFEYLCKEKDLNYWIHGNTPVILVCSKPHQNEAYWVSIKDYFSDGKLRASRKVIFDKRTDQLTKNSRAALERLAIPRGSGLYLGQLPKEEQIFSDLLEVRALPSRYMTARTSFESRRDVFHVLGSSALPPAWTIHGKVVYSFEDLNLKEWSTVCEVGTIEEHDTISFSQSEEAAAKRIFVELINVTLTAQLRDQNIWFYKTDQYYYQRPETDLTPRTASYSSRVKKTTRVLFSAYQNKDGSSVSYYRHAAFGARFMRFDGRWYLQIAPTYHYTSDGYRVSQLAPAALSGIKRLENNEAVYGQVLMWSRLLQQQTDWNAKPRRIFFGDPSKFVASVGFSDDIWLKRDVVDASGAPTSDDSAREAEQ
jgi:hypothetical protein